MRYVVLLRGIMNQSTFGRPVCMLRGVCGRWALRFSIPVVDDARSVVARLAPGRLGYLSRYIESNERVVYCDSYPTIPLYRSSHQGLEGYYPRKVTESKSQKHK